MARARVSAVDKAGAESPQDAADPAQCQKGASEVAVPAALLRQPLELAWAVARAGELAQPPIPAPSSLRRVIRFAKLPEAALNTLRKAVEEDDVFRKRVVEAATRDQIGERGWLWLTRPEGWEARLEELARAAGERHAEAEEERSQRDARRRLKALEAALDRAEVEAASARERADHALAELGGERRARRDAEREREQLRSDLESFRQRSSDDRRALVDTATRLERASAERDRAQGERDELATRLAQVTEELEALRTAVSTGQARQAEEAQLTQAAEADWRERLGRAVAEAGQAAQRLGVALGSAARTLSTPPGDTPPAESLSPSPARARPVPPAGLAPAPGRRPGAAATEAPADATAEVAVRAPAALAPGPQAPARASVRRRRPVPLPKGMYDDGPEAAAFLARIKDALFLVDGYNVSLLAWPELALPRQRRRLINALVGLHASVGTAIEVVFDGGLTDPSVFAPGIVRPAIRVTFSPHEVDADEVIIDRAATLPAVRPVVVATNDRRVRDEVERRGANTISSPQLLGLIGVRAHQR
jgi:predicted RNA-binding protein with PIN domain